MFNLTHQRLVDVIMGRSLIDRIRMNIAWWIMPEREKEAIRSQSEHIGILFSKLGIEFVSKIILTDAQPDHEEIQRLQLWRH